MGEETGFFKVNHQFFFKSTLDNSIHSLNQTDKEEGFFIKVFEEIFLQCRV